MTDVGKHGVATRGEHHPRTVGWVGWSPVLWWFIIEILVALLLVPVLFYVNPSAMTAAFFLAIFATYAFYFWIAFYAFVEFELWRHMGNLGHLYQFLGGLLIVIGVLWLIVPALLGFPTLSYGIAIVILQALSNAAGVTGLIMALYGYYHEPFHARDVDLYRNVVVRAGEHLDVLTDGYSTRVFETRYGDLPSEALRRAAEAYAVRFQKAGFYLAHRSDEGGITLYPVAYAGLGTFRWVNALRHLHRLSRQPERLTWIRIEWSGLVGVHVSPEDYAHIRRPVAHHLLCAAVADAVVGSFQAYARRDEPAAVAALLGPTKVRGPRQLDLPGRTEQRDARILVVFAATLLVTGTAGTVLSIVGSLNPYAISIVRWSPDPPVAGQSFQVFATITSLQDLPFGERLSLIWWAYFGSASLSSPSPSGVVVFDPYQGNQYVATLGPFSNGTEVTFVASLEVQGSVQGSSPTKLYQSLPHAVDIGTVVRGGASGLSLSAPAFVRPTVYPGSILGVWINSTSPITVAQVLVAGAFTYSTPTGGGYFGLGALVFDLTASGSYYSKYFGPGSLFPDAYTHLTGTLDYEFVTQDASGNTATSGLTVLQLDVTA